MKEKKLGEIRFVEDKDKPEWYKFDKHLPRKEWNSSGTSKNKQ